MIYLVSVLIMVNIANHGSYITQKLSVLTKMGQVPPSMDTWQLVGQLALIVRLSVQHPASGENLKHWRILEIFFCGFSLNDSYEYFFVDFLSNCLSNI